MRLSEFATSEPGTYVAAKFSDQTILNLNRYQDHCDIPHPVPGDDLHSTIIYSRVPLDWHTEKDVDAKATPVELMVWDQKSGDKCLVLKIKSDYLTDRFETAMELGATHDFPDYLPHITLSYKIGPDFDVEALDLPDFPIEITHEYKEALKDD